MGKDRDITDYPFGVQRSYYGSELSERLRLGRGGKVGEETKEFIFDLAEAGLGPQAITTILKVVRESSVKTSG